MGQLDGGRSHPASPSVNQQGFPGTGSSFLKEVEKGGEENFRRRSRPDKIQIVRNRNQVIGRHRHIAAVPAAGDDAKDPVARLPVVHLGSLFHHHSGKVESHDGRSSRGRRVEPAPLQQVRPVDRAGFHPHQYLPGVHGWQRCLIEGKAVPVTLPAGFVNDDGIHERFLHSSSPCSAKEKWWGPAMMIWSWT